MGKVIVNAIRAPISNFSLGKLHFAQMPTGKAYLYLFISMQSWVK